MLTCYMDYLYEALKDYIAEMRKQIDNNTGELDEPKMKLFNKHALETTDRKVWYLIID